MKKFLTVLFAVMMVLTLAGCAKEEAAPEAETVTAKGVYTVYNNTGANVGGVYIYPVGSADKGTNFVEAKLGDTYDGCLKNFRKMVIDANDDPNFAEWTGVEEEKPHFVFEFYAYDADADDLCGELIGTFENLALEEAGIVLITEDMRAGATQIAWAGKDYNEMTMNINFYNRTGKDVTSLKLYNSETKELVADVLADLGLESMPCDEEAHAWSFSEPLDVAHDIHYDVEWVYGEDTLTLGVDDTHALSFEDTAMQLLSKNNMADYNSGATCVVWLPPVVTPVTAK